MNAAPTTSLADWLLRSTPDADQRHALRRLRLQVVLPLAAVAALIALWCGWAPLAGAVVATGQPRVNSDASSWRANIRATDCSPLRTSGFPSSFACSATPSWSPSRRTASAAICSLPSGKWK